MGHVFTVLLIPEQAVILLNDNKNVYNVDAALSFYQALVSMYKKTMNIQQRDKVITHYRKMGPFDSYPKFLTGTLMSCLP